MASIFQFTEMFLEWPLSKIVSEILICPWTWLWRMGATWLYEHKQIPKKYSLKLLVRFWNNLIEMFLEWPFPELFLKFLSVNKHGISEWRLLALYRQRNSCKFFSENKQKKKRGGGLSNFKKSGERSRAILALSLLFPFYENALFKSTRSLAFRPCIWPVIVSKVYNPRNSTEKSCNLPLISQSIALVCF